MTLQPNRTPEPSTQTDPNQTGTEVPEDFYGREVKLKGANAVVDDSLD
jgi:hypothetical protein